MIDTTSKLSIDRQLELADLPKTTYYQRKKRESLGDIKKKQLEEKLDTVLMKWGEYNSPGYRKLSYSMLNENILWATERMVRKMYKLLCIHGISPVFKTTRPGKRTSNCGYLLRNRKIRFANEVWATDITYIKVEGVMVYFTAVIDLYSRKILAWRLMRNMETRECIEMVEEAIEKYGIPAIFNSDCGSQYTSEAFESMLGSYGILISHDGVGRCLDNIYVERTWRTVKYEWIFLKDYRTFENMEEGLEEFVEFFNGKRLHQSLGYKTPNSIYEAGCFPEKILA